MSSGGQVLCPGCLAQGPRLSGSCTLCGAQRHLRGRFWIEALVESQGFTRTLRAREGSAAIGIPGAEGRAVVLREVILDRDRARAEAPRLAAHGRLLSDLEARRTPGIPAFIDHFELLRGGLVHHYFVESWIDGRALAEPMAAGVRLDEAAARALAGELLTTLAALHGNDPPLLHGAIRPAHVIARGGELAEGEARHVLVGLELLGETPAPGYTPLERVMGKASPASDLYALGATLVALLSAKEPATLFNPRTQRLEFEGHLEVSPAFAGVLARMVEASPSERFASVDEVRRALAGQAVLVRADALPATEPAALPAPRAPSALAPTRALSSGDRLLAGAALLLALVALGGHVGVALWQHLALFVGIGLGALLLRRRGALVDAAREAAASSSRSPRSRPAAAPAAASGLPPALASGPAPIIEVGRGLAGIVIGESGVAEVLATFGTDCTCHCYKNGSVPGPEVAAAPDRFPQIWEVSYDYDEREEYRPSRPENERRPSSIDIDAKSGRVTRIDIGVYQRQLQTREGLTPSSTLADMRALYGDAFSMRSGEKLDLYTYPAGIEVWIARSSAEVNSFKIHAARA